MWTHEVRGRLQGDLKAAMRARDTAAVSALRTALGALANAEAPAFDAALHREGLGELVEHDRLELTADDERAVLQAEVDRRLALLEETRGSGVDPQYRTDLEAEVAVLRRYLG